MQFSGYIFDVEGTLIDCVQQNLLSLQESLVNFGVTVPFELLQLYSGLDGDQTLQIIAPAIGSDERKKVLETRAKIYEGKYLGTTKPFAGVRDVLEAIGYKEICRHFTPAPPPVSISLLDIAYCAGAGYELAFFGLLEKRIDALIEAGADNLRLSSLQLCVKHLRGTKTWTRACDALREEIVCFVREKLAFATDRARLDCSLR
jgi:hypothetical protein